MWTGFKNERERERERSLQGDFKQHFSSFYVLLKVHNIQPVDFLSVFIEMSNDRYRRFLKVIKSPQSNIVHAEKRSYPSVSLSRVTSILY